MYTLNTTPPPTAPALQTHLHALLHGEQTPETHDLHTMLVRTIRARIRQRVYTRYSDLFRADDLHDLHSEVHSMLLLDALFKFRGQHIGALISFVRTITDRHIWHTAQRRIREKKQHAEHMAAVIHDTPSTSPDPEATLIAIPSCPLDSTDTSYLLGLIRAGSQANYARQQSVSRAAVTQRLKRIRARVHRLTPAEQHAVRHWIHQQTAKMAISF